MLMTNLYFAFIIAFAVATLVFTAWVASEGYLTLLQALASAAALIFILGVLLHTWRKEYRDHGNSAD